jgi:hypothetical protein
MKMEGGVCACVSKGFRRKKYRGIDKVIDMCFALEWRAICVSVCEAAQTTQTNTYHDDDGHDKHASKQLLNPDPPSPHSSIPPSKPTYLQGILGIRQLKLVMQRRRRRLRRFLGAVRQKRTPPMRPRRLVSNHRQLKNRSILGKDRPQSFLPQVLWDLPHKKLDRVLLLGRARVGGRAGRVGRPRLGVATIVHCVVWVFLVLAAAAAVAAAAADGCRKDAVCVQAW